MTAFRVWDPLNEEEESGLVIEADDDEAAAIEYAERDSASGFLERYTTASQPLSVRDPEGAVHRVRVSIDFEPQFVGERV